MLKEMPQGLLKNIEGLRVGSLPTSIINEH